MTCRRLSRTRCSCTGRTAGLQGRGIRGMSRDEAETLAFAHPFPAPGSLPCRGRRQGNRGVPRGDQCRSARRAPGDSEKLGRRALPLKGFAVAPTCRPSDQGLSSSQEWIRRRRRVVLIASIERNDFKCGDGLHDLRVAGPTGMTLSASPALPPMILRPSPSLSWSAVGEVLHPGYSIPEGVDSPSA